jgi:hypothetical protein
MIADHDDLGRPEQTQKEGRSRALDTHHRSEARCLTLPAWFSGRMIGEHGSFGLLLTTGDVLRVTSITAVAESLEGTQLIDVLLDSAGVPQGVDLAWQSKHYLGAPVPGATLATLNAAHVVAPVSSPRQNWSNHQAIWPLKWMMIVTCRQSWSQCRRCRSRDLDSHSNDLPRPGFPERIIVDCAAAGRLGSSSA